MSEPISEAEVAALEYSHRTHPFVARLCTAWRSLTAENERQKKHTEWLIAHNSMECFIFVNDKLEKAEQQVAEQAAEIKRLNQELAGERMKDMNAETVRLATLDCMEERDKEQRAEIKCLVAAAEQNQKVIAEQAATIERMRKFSM